jgi:branched-chain amino acid transport system permease protein
VSGRDARRAPARLLVGAGVVAALVLVPLVFSTYFTGAVASRALYIGLAAASLAFLAGYGGMVSLAQTALYGIGGFVMARLIVQSGLDPVPAALVAIAVAVAFGVLFGAISSGSEGIYLLMITLALGVITYFFFSQVTTFGGHEGINGVRTPSFVGDPVRDPRPIYYLALGCSVAAYLLIRYLGRTAFGLALQGVRDDPVRMRALGYNVRLHRTLGFAAGALLAAVAGVLGTWHETRISPGTIDVSQTIQLLTIAVIGGLYRIEGAWIGALLYTLLDTYARGLTGRFETWIGLILLAILVVSPDGITGLAGSIRDRVRGRRARAARAKHPSESLSQPTPLDPTQVTR